MECFRVGEMPVDGQEVVGAVGFLDDDGYFVAFVEEGEVEVLKMSCCPVAVVDAVGPGCSCGLDADFSVAEEFEGDFREVWGGLGICIVVV